jgi:hypothetical protein
MRLGKKMSDTAQLSPEVIMHHGLIFQAFECVIGDERAIYLSGPITTGLAWVEAVQAGKPDRDTVIAANSAVMRDAARKLRNETRQIVIEPASLTVRGWSQEDYLELWTNVIEKHASEVRFMRGWQYSIGCALEFRRAARRHIATTELDGARISAADGVDALNGAVSDLRLRSRRTESLQALAVALSAVAEEMAGALHEEKSLEAAG